MGLFDLSKIPQPPEKVPDDLSELFWCPVCGHTAMKGILEVQGRWLKCSECRFCVTDSDSTRIWLTKVPQEPASE